ncbi:MAG: glucose-6-phosphate dehydrogenase [Halanaerobium sp.]
MNTQTLEKLYKNPHEKNISSNFQFILFGGTGDLAHNKIMPAFYNLVEKDILPQHFTLLATGRRYNSKKEYLDAIYSSLNNKKKEVDNRVWQVLADSIDYFELNFKDDSDFMQLKDYLAEKSKKNKVNNRIFYLATAPGFFAEIAEKIKKFNLLNVGFEHKDSKLVIEKPFGHDLQSAEKLNNTLTNIFEEKNIYRIDHYLGKEMIQNIMVIRLSNPIFRSLWNTEEIDNIQIYIDESEGVKDRGKYYDDAGVIKDMFQNHMLQILSLITMEEPSDLSAKSISKSKVQVLKELSKINIESIDEHIIRGQYISSKYGDDEIKAYRDEKDIPDDSETATFIALKLFLDNERWKNVPIYLKSGKRLKKKEAGIAVEFNHNFHESYSNTEEVQSNLLKIMIQPDEGVSLRFNTRKPGSNNKIVPVEMEFCHSAHQLFNSPENYEGLIYDMIKGDKTLFTSWQEVYYSWKFIDKFQTKCNTEDLKLHKYPALSKGPEAADKLLEDDGRIWWD